VDFSQFKVRGHYTHSERLGRYFKCVMWLGRIDLAVAGGPFDRGCGLQLASPRELGRAIVLCHLLNQSGQFTANGHFIESLEVRFGSRGLSPKTNDSDRGRFFVVHLS